MHEHREPLIRISKRDSISKPWAWGIRLIAVVLSLIVSAIIIYALVKMNPLEVYASMWNGAFDETNLFAQIFTFSLTPKTWYFIRDVMILACISIGLAPAFKMKFWNIGAEGQVLVGCIASAFFMINFAGKMATPLLFVCMIVSSILFGAIWGLIPGFFKAKWNTNETLFTLMMNYIAIRVTAFCVSKWENPPGSNSVGTIRYQGKDRIGWIGDMFANDKPVKFGNDYMWLVLIVIAVAIFMFIYLRKAKHGYEIAVVGDSENTARYAGIRVQNLYVRTMALSGAICGLTGFLIVSAVDHTISTASADGRGFTAIIVAWLAKMNPFVMFLISALLVFLDKGASQIATDYQISEYASEIISGIVLFFILGSEFFINYNVKIGHNKKEG